MTSYIRHRFHFYGGLKHFLAKNKQKGVFSHPVRGAPAIKDVIESLGVPHSEVDCLLVDGRSVGFSYRLKEKGAVKVYPDARQVSLPGVKRLKPKALRQARFIVDVHLGKLARCLRLLGLDTLYRNDFTPAQIIQASRGRLILTRSARLLKNKAVRRGYFVRQNSPKKQVREVLRQYDLYHQLRPLTRCVDCNARVARVAKAKVSGRLPPATRIYYNEFYLCRGCQKVYWKGSHFENISAFLLRIL